MQTKKICLTKICFNHEQEHISQVVLIQVSVFQTICLLFNTVFFFSNGSYISETDKFFCCIYVYIYIYIYIYIYVCVCVCIYICIYVYIIPLLKSLDE